ncbi:MAG: hypothetical protein QOF02_3663 [Blastocatellia bacterium]|nr:hypothetical protein [Blastocatellia bacterium]
MQRLAGGVVRNNKTRVRYVEVRSYVNMFLRQYNAFMEIKSYINRTLFIILDS